MKVIHCADIHIGAVMQNLPADKAKIRKREILDTFFEMLRFACQNNVAAVIIAGDLFDVRKVARSVRKEILDAIAAASQTDILYLTGNHDAKIGLTDDGLAAPANLYRFQTPDDWTYFHYGDVCIAGIDMERQSGYGFYEKLNFDKSKFNIAVLHDDLKTIRLDKLKGKHIDYLALGDIHIPDLEPKKLDGRGVYAYSGCLEGHGYDESGARGFFLLDIEKEKLTRTFYPIAKRRYDEIALDITGLDGHTKIYDALRRLTEASDKNNILHVTLVGTRRADVQIERESLERKLSEQFFHAKIKDRSKLDAGSVLFENEISLRSEFVKLVKNSALSEAEQDKILEYGIKALCGEAVDL